jgi:hypothetical protein
MTTNLDLDLLNSLYKLIPIVVLGIYLGRLEKRLETLEKDFEKRLDK